MNQCSLPKIVVLLGPTASGKSTMGLALAREFGFEIINADSRQVYKKLQIGAAKPPGHWQAHPQTNESIYAVEGIPHYLLDAVDLERVFTLAEWKAEAETRVGEILGRGRRVLVVGGTGLYIDALAKNFQMPARAESNALRVKLQKKPLSELVALLRESDNESAARVDLRNPRRVLRALEAFFSTGKSFIKQQKKGTLRFAVLKIGIRAPMEELTRRINARVDEMMSAGFLEEARELLAAGYSDDLPALSGIGYRELAAHLKGEMSFSEAVKKIKIATRQYAKRQITWFKRDSSIKWVESREQARNFVIAFYGLV